MTPHKKRELEDIRFSLLKQSPVVFVQLADMDVFKKSLHVVPPNGITALKQYYDFVISNGIVDDNLKELDRAKLVDEEISRRQSIRISTMFNINLN